MLNKGKESSTFPASPIWTMEANNKISTGDLFPNEEWMIEYNVLLAPID